jgi:hypothetical protein
MCLHLKAQQTDDTIIPDPDSSKGAVRLKEDQGMRKRISDPVIFRAVPDTTVTRMKGEKEFVYANDPSYWQKEKKVYRKGFWDYFFDFFESRTIRVIFYLSVVALAIFVLYRVIVLNNLFIFYSSKKHKQVLEQVESRELDRSVIDQKIREAIGNKEYNGAVRYLYLKTLYTLNDHNLIRYHADATNSEYISQMKEHKKIREFRFLTQVYEYVWYGKFEINEEQFALVYDSFQNFQPDRS